MLKVRIKSLEWVLTQEVCVLTKKEKFKCRDRLLHQRQMPRGVGARNQGVAPKPRDAKNYQKATRS